MGLTDTAYDVPNIRAENAGAPVHVRIGWFRAVANNYHAFAAHSFADEMAHAAGRDTLEFLLDMIGPGQVIDLKAQGVDYSNYGAPIDKYPVDSRRLRRVLEVAGEKSNWGKRKPGNGWGIGIAAHRSFNTYVASVVEVEVDAQGRVRIPRIDQVADAGVFINPDRVRSQFEGAAVMGAGLAMLGEITAANGRIQQNNFDGFQVARMNNGAGAGQRALCRERQPADGCRRAGRAAGDRRARQRDLRRHRQARPRAAVFAHQTRVTEEAQKKAERRRRSRDRPGQSPQVGRPLASSRSSATACRRWTASRTASASSAS